MCAESTTRSVIAGGVGFPDRLAVSFFATFVCAADTSLLMCGITCVQMLMKIQESSVPPPPGARTVRSTTVAWPSSALLLMNYSCRSSKFFAFIKMNSLKHFVKRSRLAHISELKQFSVDPFKPGTRLPALKLRSTMYCTDVDRYDEKIFHAPELLRQREKFLSQHANAESTRLAWHLIGRRSGLGTSSQVKFALVCSERVPQPWEEVG